MRRPKAPYPSSGQSTIYGFDFDRPLPRRRQSGSRSWDPPVLQKPVPLDDERPTDQSPAPHDSRR